jgi:hypothetical protein
MHVLKNKTQAATQPARGLSRLLIVRCTPRPPGSSNLPSLFKSLLMSRAKLAAGPSVLFWRFISVKFERAFARRACSRYSTLVPGDLSRSDFQKKYLCSILSVRDISSSYLSPTHPAPPHPPQEPQFDVSCLIPVAGP